MNKEIYKLKNLLYDLEYYIQRDRLDKILDSTNKIKSICNEIESKVDGDKIVIDYENVNQNNEYSIINVLDFIYMPFNYALEDDHNYIKKFSNRRFENLKESSALGDHNNFWSQHETIYGNIYGSVPIELLNAKKVALLKKAGWKEVKVEILDFDKENYDKEGIKNFCKKNLYKYIILKEKETSQYLVLNYNVNIDGVYK